MRRPGLEMRFSPATTGSPFAWYFRFSTMVPCTVSFLTCMLLTYPSSTRIWQIAFFRLEAGTSTEGCLAVLALRMRVSRSAIGAVMCMPLTSFKVLRFVFVRTVARHSPHIYLSVRPLAASPAAPNRHGEERKGTHSLKQCLPAGFLHAGDLALVSELTEADTADTVLAQVG